MRNSSRLAACTDVAKVRSREGFRMPAGRDLYAGDGAGVRKPPRKEPAGAWWAVCVYGDLIEQQPRRGMAALAS